MKTEEKKQWLKDHWAEIESFTRSREEYFGNIFYASLDEKTRRKEIETLIADSLKDEEDQWKLEESNCKEEVCGIDIHEYLEEFRYTMDKEKILYLVFDGGKIIDKMLLASSVTAILSTDVPTQKLIKYYQDGKQLYCCHNHPCQISAIPSSGDVLALAHVIPKYYYAKEMNASIRRAPEKIERIKTEQPYEFIDWAIVTPCDYYSYQQLGDISERLLDKEK